MAFIAKIILGTFPGIAFVYFHSFGAAHLKPNSSVSSGHYGTAFRTSMKLNQTKPPFYEISSGNCASKGLERILDIETCIQAANSFGHELMLSFQETHRIKGCFMKRGSPPSSASERVPKLLSGDKLPFEAECKPERVCFCSNPDYTSHARNIQIIENRYYATEWSLNLDGKEFLLQSDVLRYRFAQVVKDYWNQEIQCDFDVESANLGIYSLELVEAESTYKLIGGCRGTEIICSRVLDANTSKRNGRSCALFNNMTIFDFFKDNIYPTPTFKYRANADLVTNIDGFSELQYNVSFHQNESNGLSRIDTIKIEPEKVDIMSSNPPFTDTQFLKTIFEYYFDETLEATCFHSDINCNRDKGTILSLWFVNKDLQGKLISEIFNDLQNLECLFFAGNRLGGAIPGNLPNSLKVLWIANNGLTGTIPNALENLVNLLEINLKNNSISGPIPAKLEKLVSLKHINLGDNFLTGSIPGLYIKNEEEEEPEDPPSNDFCGCFENSFISILCQLLRDIFFNDSKFVRNEVDRLVNLRGLALYNNKLEGSIPTEFSFLQELEYLILSGNSLKGEIPNDLFEIKSLNHLDLHENLFTGRIPEGIGGLKNLKTLNLYDNYFEKNIPISITNLLELEELVLDKNKLTGQIHVGLGNLRSLKSLTLSRNRMSGLLPTELGNLESLVYLDFRDYRVRSPIGSKRVASTIPYEFGNLNSLRFLIFESNDVTGNIPPHIGNLTSIEMVWLNDQKLTGTLPQEIFNLKSLQVLSIRNNELSGVLSSKIDSITGLKALDIGNNAFRGEIPSTLGNLPALKVLNLGEQDLSGTIPIHLYQLSSLKYLVLYKNSLSGQMHPDFGNLLNLTVLIASENKFTGVIPSSFGFLPQLENLDIGSNLFSGTIPIELGNGRLFKRGAKEAKLLKFFRMSDNALEGELPQFNNFPFLKEIDISSNKIDGTLPISIGNLPALSLFYVQNNEIKGTIPSQLGNLAFLKEISFGNNQLNGSIPTELGQLDTLERMDLENNDLEGSLPSEMGNLGLLVVLNLTNNKIEGSIPSEVGSITTLEVFDVSSNNIIGSIPSEIGTLTALTALNIEDNGINGTLPTEIGNLQSLGSLDVGDNQISGNIPSEIGMIAVLLILDVGNNDISGDLPVEIQELPLDSIFLEGNNFTSTIDMYFTCKHRSLSFDNFLEYECSNFCGRDNEECNITSLNGAQCSDVGCSSGTPSCTETCRLDFSSCSPAPDQSLFELNLLLDSEAWETNWDIIDIADNIAYSPFYAYRNFELYKEIRCIAKACYSFQLVDSGNDGICCGDSLGDQGNYSLYVDGIATENTDPNFEMLISHEIGSCTAAPTKFGATLEPTYLPSMAPSLSPSRHPSSYPSSYPSSNPSNLPSLLPSLSPTLLPSGLPSIIPSLVPSITPTLDPTGSTPTTSPTKNPSVAPSTMPSSDPTSTPSLEPSSQPSSEPSMSPSVSMVPTTKPSIFPSSFPSYKPVCVDLAINFDFHVNEISWNFTKSGLVVQQKNYLTDPDPPPPRSAINESFCFNGGACVTFNLMDSAGDGLQNGERNYDYNLTVDNVEVAGTSGNFGSSVSHDLNPNYC